MAPRTRRAWGLRRYESGATCDRIPLDVVTALELLTVRRGNQWDSDAVTPPIAVRLGTSQNQQVLWFLGWPILAPIGVELREGVVGHAAPSPRPRVGHDSDVLLNVDGVFAELLKERSSVCVVSKRIRSTSGRRCLS